MPKEIAAPFRRRRMRRSPDHRKRKSAGIYYITGRRRYYIIPFAGRRCQYSERGVDMEMETDCELYTIPKCVYRKLYDESGIVKDYTMEMISEKFSDIMWLFNQFVFSNVASRIASALLDHKVMERSDSLAITHEALARDAGTAREVVTRILKQFQADGLVKLTRGKVEILNEAGLRKI